MKKKSQRKGKIQQSTKIVPTNLNDITVYRISTYIVHITVEVAELTSCSNYNTTLSTEDLSCKKNKHTLKYPSLIFTKCIQFITTSLKDFVTRFSFSFQSNYINYFLLLTKKKIWYTIVFSLPRFGINCNLIRFVAFIKDLLMP